MQRLVLLVVAVIVGPSVMAQDSLTLTAMRSQNILNRLAGQSGIGQPVIIAEMPFAPKRLIGNTYLTDDWNTAVILLYKESSLLEGIPAKYDVQANELEIKTPAGNKVLSGSQVKSFAWTIKETGNVAFYDNVKTYQQDFANAGMFQRLSEGELILLKKTDVIMQPADYNVALNVGSHDDHLIKKDKFYYATKNKVVAKLPKSRKKLIELFGSSGESMDKFIQSGSLTLTEESDLIKIFNHYNSLEAK